MIYDTISEMNVINLGTLLGYYMIIIRLKCLAPMTTYLSSTEVWG